MFIFVWVLFFWALPSLAADSPVAEQIARMESQVAELQRRMPVTESERKTITGLAETGITQSANLQAQLVKEWDGFLIRLRVPDNERTEFNKLFSSDAADSGHLAAFPGTITLLRAHVLQGNQAPMQMGLELMVAGLRMTHYRLVCFHALQSATASPPIPLADFDKLLLSHYSQLALLFSLYPEFPEILMGALRNKTNQLDFSKLIPLLNIFSTGPPMTTLPAEFAGPGKFSATKLANLLGIGEGTLKGVLNAVATAEITTQELEHYHLTHYPQSAKQEVLEHLAVVLRNVPGLRECVNLTKSFSDNQSKPTSYSDFEGAPCDFKAYEGALRRYVGFYRANQGTTLLPTLEDFFKTSADNFRTQSEMRDALGSHILTDATDDFKKQWPAIEDRIFQNPDTIERWKTTDALTLTRDLKDVLSNSGIQIQEGLDINYSENLNQAEHLVSNLKNMDTNARTSAGEIVSIDSQTPCETFLRKDRSDNRVIQTVRQAESYPSAEESSHGFARLVRLFEVKLSNLATIQNPETVHITLAGLLGQTIRAQLLTNYVQTQLLLGARLNRDLKLPRSPFIQLMENRYGYLSADAIMAQAADVGATVIDDSFRKDFRTKLLSAANQIQKLDALITRLNTRAEAARMAPPGLSKILNIPPEFTGETDKSQASQMNQALIDLAGYVRWDFVERHSPGKTIHALRKINSATRLSIDQFKEQIDWYSGIENGRVTRPPRYTDFIGREELDILQKHPVLQGMLINHVDAIMDGPRDYAVWTRDLLISRYPMLTHVDASSGRKTDLWRNYRDQDFDKTLTSHLTMIQKTLTLFLAETDLDTFFNSAIHNGALLDYVLRRHPDQKLASCTEQRRVEAIRLRNERIVTGLSSLALSLSLIPEVGPAAAFIPGVIAVGITASENSKARMAAAQSHAYQIASLAQRSDSDRALDPVYQRKLEDQYLVAQVEHVLSIVGLASAGTIRFSRMAKLLGSFERAMQFNRLRTVRFFRGWRATSAAPWVKSLASSGTRLPALRFGLRVFDITKRSGQTARDFFFYPFHRLGLTAPFGSNWRLLSQLNPGLSRTKRVSIRLWHSVEDGSHIIGNLPLSPIGLQFGSGTAGLYLQGYTLYELGNWGFQTWRAYQAAARELVVARLHETLHSEQPNSEYIDLIDAVYSGSLTVEEAARVIETSRSFGFEEALTDVVKSNGAIEARNSLDSARKALESQPKSPDPIHEYAKARALTQMRKILDQIH